MTYQLYWGDLHSHCSISYGHGTVQQALLRARQQLDFCSITGHAFWPDMPTDRERYADIIDYHRAGFATLTANWDELIRLQSQGTTPGEFIAFPSYEWHSLEYGDHNVYAPGPELPLVNAPDLTELRNVARQSGSIAIPHHVGYRAGFRGINWSAYREDVSPFIEVFSLHGCSVSDDAPYPMLHDMGPRDAGSTAEAGWRLGHRFGIVGGTDHHAAYPGSHRDGRMGVFARALTRESLWEACLARRVYAATGDRIDARMFLNDAWIGDCVHAPDRRTIHVEVEGSDALDKVELIRNGQVIQRFFPAPADVHPRRHRYRLRLTWGWGKGTEPVEWAGQAALSEGTIERVETLFSGQPVVAPKGQETSADHVLDSIDLPHELTESCDQSLAFRSVTTGNRTMRHESTQGISLLVEAPLAATLTIEVNGVRIRHSLAELLHAGRSQFLRGWLSEAIRVGPLIPLDECRVTAEYRDRSETASDYYRLQVAQKNGQWAWLSPVWATV